MRESTRIERGRVRVGEKNVSLSLASVSARKVLGWRNQTKPNRTEPNERKRGVERRGAARRRLLSISGHRYTSRPAARAYGIRTSARPTMCGGEREARPASRPAGRLHRLSSARPHGTLSRRHTNLRFHRTVHPSDLYSTRDSSSIPR